MGSHLLESSTQQLLFGLVVLVVSWLVLRWRRQTAKLPPGTRRPPCLPSVPVLGSLPFMVNNLDTTHVYLMKKGKTLGNVFGFYLGSSYAVVLNDAEAVREAFLKKSAHFAGRAPFFLQTVDNPERKGIEPAPYDDDFRRKHKLYLSILREFGFGKRLMETRVHEEVAEFVHRAQLTDGKTFDPYELVHTCILNVLVSLMFGQRYPYGHPTLLEIRGSFTSVVASFVQEVEMFRFLQHVPPFRGRATKCANLIKSMGEMLDREVNITLWNADHEQGDRVESFVRRFVELTSSTHDNQKPLSEAVIDRKELIEVLANLLFGGVVTVAGTLLWGLLLIGNHPDVQTRMYQELEEVVGSDRLPSLEDESKLPYTQAVILETLRRYTLIPLSTFRETTCDTQVGDFFIEDKTVVIPNLYSIHMDSTTWNEPEKFKPERFLDEHGQVTGKDRLVAFSMGKRACIGESLARQELFLFIAGIVQNFEILPPEGEKSIAFEEIVELIMKPSPYRFRLSARRVPRLVRSMEKFA